METQKGNGMLFDLGTRMGRLEGRMDTMQKTLDFIKKLILGTVTFGGTVLLLILSQAGVINLNELPLISAALALMI